MKELSFINIRAYIRVKNLRISGISINFAPFFGSI